MQVATPLGRSEPLSRTGIDLQERTAEPKLCRFSMRSEPRCLWLLLGGHLFLLAFHAHRLELALLGVVRLLYLGLDLGCRLLQLR